MPEDSFELQDSWDWQDWSDMLLGIWLATSPWILGFGNGDAVAAGNAVLVGSLIAILGALTFLAYHIVEQWIDVMLGVWLVLSPWLLPTAGSAAMVADFTLVGAAVLALSGREIWNAGHGRPHPV